MNKKQEVTAARRRFRIACNSRFDATGSILSCDIAFKVARRTGVPVRALFPDIDSTYRQRVFFGHRIGASRPIFGRIMFH